jgi:hypothetical protein
VVHYLASFAASVAAAVTGTETPETHAAGCRFGPTQPATRARRPLRYRVSVLSFAGSEVYAADIVASEWRAASRLFARRIRETRPIPCPDGPAVRFGRFRIDGAAVYGSGFNAEGSECVAVVILRADSGPGSGRPIRAGRKGGAA